MPTRTTSRKAVSQRRVTPKAARKATSKRTRQIKATRVKDPTTYTGPHFSAEALLLDVLNASPAGAAITRYSDGTVLYANPAIAAYFGVPLKDTVGMTTAMFFPELSSRGRFLAALTEKGAVDRMEFQLRTGNGEVKEALISARAITFKGAPAIAVWMEDETAARRREDSQRGKKQIDLVQTAAGIASRAAGLYDALRQGSTEIARYIGWPIRLIYRLAPGRQDVLQLATFSIAKGVVGQQELRSILSGATYGKGEDLPGRVLAGGKPVWVEDVATDKGLKRFTGKVGGRIASAVAVPIVVDGNVVAVLEFLNPAPKPVDATVLKVLTQAGAEIARTKGK